MRSFVSIAPAVGLCLGLAACVGTSETGRLLQTDPTADSPAAARSIYAGRTFLTYSDQHGTQIEYHGPDGRAHLWYPRNPRGVPSNWKVEYDGPGNGHDVCWQYPGRSINPVTGQSGGRFECTPDWLFFSGVVQVLAGDPFGLDSGRVPFRLPQDRFDAETLAQMSGIPAARIRTIYKDE